MAKTKRQTFWYRNEDKNETKTFWFVLESVLLKADCFDLVHHWNKSKQSAFNKTNSGTKSKRFDFVYVFVIIRQGRCAHQWPAVPYPRLFFAQCRLRYSCLVLSCSSGFCRSVRRDVVQRPAVRTACCRGWGGLRAGSGSGTWGPDQRFFSIRLHCLGAFFKDKPAVCSAQFFDKVFSGPKIIRLSSLWRWYRKEE